MLASNRSTVTFHCVLAIGIFLNDNQLSRVGTKLPIILVNMLRAQLARAPSEQ